MSYTVIEDASATLLDLLRTEIPLTLPSIDSDDIVLLSPAEVADQPLRVSLFLYAIVENPYLKNEERRIISPSESQYPPLSLDLYYLLTTYADPTVVADPTLEAHRVMGLAMRIFYDHGILSGSALKGSLATRNAELRLSLNPITVEDLTRLWSVFPNRPYRTSVSYLVTPARIDSNRREPTLRVVSKEMDHDHLVPTPERL